MSNGRGPGNWRKGAQGFQRTNSGRFAPSSADIPEGAPQGDDTEETLAVDDVYTQFQQNTTYLVSPDELYRDRVGAVAWYPNPLDKLREGAAPAGVNLAGEDRKGADLGNGHLHPVDSGRPMFYGHGPKSPDSRPLVPHTRETVVAALAEAERTNSRVDLRRAQLVDVDLSGLDLQSANLEGAYLNRVNLNDTNLYNADLRGATITHSRGKDTNLMWAKMNDANVSFTTFNRANLGYADLTSADLYNVNFVRTHHRNTEMRDVHGMDVRFEGADLHKANLTDSNLLYTTWDRSTVTDVDFTGGRVSFASSRNANFSLSKMPVNLVGANFRRANLYGADLTGSNVAGADLFKADLTGAKLNNTFWRDAYTRKTRFPDGFTADSLVRKPRTWWAFWR